MVQRVKDPALPLLWYTSQLWFGFDPWPGELPYATGTAKKERGKKKRMILNAGLRVDC